MIPEDAVNRPCLCLRTSKQAVTRRSSVPSPRTLQRQGKREGCQRFLQEAVSCLSSLPPSARPARKACGSPKGRITHLCCGTSAVLKSGPSGRWSCHKAKSSDRTEWAACHQAVAAALGEKGRAQEDCRAAGRAASAAFEWLMAQRGKYRDFVQARDRHVGTGWLPLGILLEPFLECALWPNLYPTTAFCDGWSPEDEEPEDGLSDEPWSLRKASFTRKLRSGILDYHFWTDLHVFQFDRWLFGRITGAGRSADCPVYQAIHNMTFASAHRRLKYVLCDLHQQLGPACLFLTLAPYELSLPYAEQLKRDMQPAGLGRMRCAALEVPWAVHVSLEVVLRYLCGIGAKPLTNPVLRNRSVYNGKSLVKAAVIVAELQSGARQVEGQRAQLYHGRDAAHFHTLIWLERLDVASLEHVITADLPQAATPERRIAATVQGSHMPAHEVRHAPTRVLRGGHGDMRGYEWRYSAEAAAAGIRPYILEILAPLRSHMDIQVVSSTAGISAYVAKLTKYLAKDARDVEESLGKDPWRFAHAFLQQCRPGEAELQMLLQRLPLQRFNGRAKHLQAPTFATASDHGLLQKYLCCRDRCTTMCFKAWLRAYRTDLQVPRPYKARGLVAVFLEQWLLLHIALVSAVEELQCEDAARLPAELQSMCYALACAPDIWGQDATVRAELTLHGETGANLHNLVRTWRSFWQAGSMRGRKHSCRSHLRQPS